MSNDDRRQWLREVGELLDAPVADASGFNFFTVECDVATGDRATVGHDTLDEAREYVANLWEYSMPGETVPIVVGGIRPGGSIYRVAVGTGLRPATLQDARLRVRELLDARSPDLGMTDGGAAALRDTLAAFLDTGRVGDGDTIATEDDFWRAYDLLHARAVFGRAF